MAHRAVIFAIAQLSCFMRYQHQHIRRRYHSPYRALAGVCRVQCASWTIQLMPRYTDSHLLWRWYKYSTAATATSEIDFHW